EPVLASPGRIRSPAPATSVGTCPPPTLRSVRLRALGGTRRGVGALLFLIGLIQSSGFPRASAPPVGKIAAAVRTSAAACPKVPLEVETNLRPYCPIRDEKIRRLERIGGCCELPPCPLGCARVRSCLSPHHACILGAVESGTERRQHVPGSTDTRR